MNYQELIKSDLWSQWALLNIAKHSGYNVYVQFSILYS